MKIRRKDVLNYVEISLSNSKVLGSEIKLRDIQYFCENEKITVKPSEIKEFLKLKALESGIDMDKPEVLQTVTLVDGKDNSNLIEASLKRMMNHLKREKYEFNEIDLRYFKDLFKIYTSKCLKLCEVLKMMSGEIEIDSELIDDLDITINNQNVLTEDIDRIIKPLIHNFCKAFETLRKANDLDTYLTKTIDEHNMAVDGISYGECLPHRELQNKRFNLFGVEDVQYVALTEKQENELRAKKIENFKASMKNFLDD